MADRLVIPSKLAIILKDGTVLPKFLPGVITEDEKMFEYTDRLSASWGQQVAFYQRLPIDPVPTPEPPRPH